MSNATSPNRWIPFQCPSCSGLFRIRKAQVGLTGRCPVCRAAVQSALSESVVDENGAEDDVDLLARVAVAESMTPEEIEAKELARRTRRKLRPGEVEASIDWEEGAGEPRSKRVSWKIVTSIILSALCLLALALYYIEETTPAPVAKNVVPPQDVEKAEKLLDEIEKVENLNEIKNKTDTDAAKTVDDYKKFDLVKVEEAVKSFLTAKSPEELKKLVRDPERVSPFIDRYYAQVDYEAEGFDSLKKHEVSYRGNILTTVVTKADFLNEAIAIERVLDGAEEAYLIDWESWTGYCDYSPEEMRKKKPVEPFVMRVALEPASYYNYSFSDDQKWASLSLELRDSTYSFLGYVKIGSKVHQQLQLKMKNGGPYPCVVKVAYPAGARAADQVEVLEILTDGWIIGLKPKNKEDE